MGKQKLKVIVWLGIFSILVTGIVHAIDAPDAFEEAAYKGWLFCLNCLGSFFVAFCLYFRKESLGWYLGFAISLFSIILYAVSRTVGLPQIPAEPDAWLEPLGVVSIIAEALFVLLFIYSRKEKR